MPRFNCESRIEFAMEAPTFVSSFRCEKGWGHNESEHRCHGHQRQMREGVLKRYTVTWTEVELPSKPRVPEVHRWQGDNS